MRFLIRSPPNPDDAKTLRMLNCEDVFDISNRLAVAKQQIYGEKQKQKILVGSSMGGWLMLLAALARPEKTAALVGISTAADHFVTAFNSLPTETKKEIEEQGFWKFPTKHNEEGFYTLSMDFLKEAENHCILQSPIPVSCPVRLIHGLEDTDVPWHISMQVAERVLSNDVDVILRKHGQHRMSEKDDIKLMVYTIDDLVDKLTTLG
ncbi:hypothetical protein cypCar_00039387 [Cyprinus carpio]|nr:hypothetical protein cypCar_00039387 [Cyprinus carpio]